MLQQLVLPIRLTTIKAASIFFISLLLAACTNKVKNSDLQTKLMDTTFTVKMATSINSMIKPELADGLKLSVWGIDSLVISPIAIDIDDNGKLYYATTNRQKNSEFDIRGHTSWEIESIQLQTVEEKRIFLHKELSPENSSKNEWLKDLNGDKSHDWKDMTIEKENIYRLEDKNGDGIADYSQQVVNDFNDEVTDVVGGVFSDGDNLYVAVAPDLWRMKDKNGDGIADEKKSISNGYGIHIGFGGHGMSGIEMGPDGKIYWQIGDIGFNGKGQDGQEWNHANSGVIARANPDGSDFEIFAAGLRNTHEFAFDEYGNLISEDNDGDHAGEKERLVYIVNGSDAGWRSNWQYGKYRDPKNNSYKVWMDEKMYLPRFEGQAAYITPCISNFVSGPAGFVYNPGTALGPEYNKTFFVAEFVGSPNNSGIHAFKLNIKGASFELGEHKKVVGGILPTGLDFGPDGALYAADWIEGWDTHNFGRIWKLDTKEIPASPLRIKTKQLLASDFTKNSDIELAEQLKNQDMRVRLKAQFELVKRGGKGAVQLLAACKQTDNQLARVHGIWGIAQLARQEQKHGLSLIPLLNDSDAEIRAQAAKWLGDIKYREAGKSLIPLLKDTNSRVRFFAAEALGRIKLEEAINPLIEFLKVNDDKDAYLRHAGSLALARIGKAVPIIALSTNHSRAVRIAAVVALRRMKDAGIRIFMNDSDEFIVTETARAINDDLSIPDALPALGNLISSTQFTNEALLRRIINANLRVGNEESLQNMVAYIQKESAPPAMRAEAIDALSVWANPSVLDRVDGRYRGVFNRESTLLINKVTAVFIKLLKDKQLAVRLSAVKAINLLTIKQSSVPLLYVLKTDKDPLVRAESIRALVALKDPQLEQAIRLGISDKDKIVRVAGLDLLEKMNLPKELMAGLLTEVLLTKTMEEKQAALLTLGRLPLSATQKVFDELLIKMEGNKLAPELYLELGEALDSTHSSALVLRYKEINAKLSNGDLNASYAGSLLGGDAKKGAGIFYNNQNAQCVKCHAIDDYGGNAGPRLNGVAKRISRQQILEAMIAPSAKLAKGYGVVTLTLKDGKKTAGILKEETNTSFILKGGDKPDEIIAKNQVTKREDAPSSMPDMKLILSKKEIRDLVSFIFELREEK